MPAVARMPEPSEEVKATAAAKALAAMMRREATDDGEQEMLTRERPGRQSRARGSIAEHGAQHEVVTTTEPKAAPPCLMSPRTLSNTSRPVVDKLRTAVRKLCTGAQKRPSGARTASDEFASTVPWTPQGGPGCLPRRDCAPSLSSPQSPRQSPRQRTVVHL